MSGHFENAVSSAACPGNASGKPPALISVVIPCYNHAHFLPEAVESVLSQSYGHVEVIVVDDGSTDPTPEVAAQFGDRIRYIRQPNAGLSSARNAGIAAASGELLNFLDADDTLQPDMLSHMATAAQRHCDVDVFCSSFQFVDVEGQVLSRHLPTDFPADVFHFLLERNRMPCHTKVVRRAAVEKVGPFDPQLRSLEDWDLWLRLAGSGSRFLAVPAACANYRRYPGSMSRNYETMRKYLLTVLERHATIHGRCRLCARARRRSRRNLRAAALAAILLPNVRDLWRRGQRREAVRQLADALRDDPRMIDASVSYWSAAVFEVAGRRLRRMWRTHRARRMPAS